MDEKLKHNYEEDARLLIRKLVDNEIELKYGALNHIGVQILIETANEILSKESVGEAISKIKEK
jgi:hypothetical protein